MNVDSRGWDVVVIGAGPNGLVAANVLADHGWSVLVLEAEPEVGGAVRSARDVHPDFVHDTFSAFYPLAAASHVISAMELQEYGLVWRHAPAVLGHPLADGAWALLHRDRLVTAAAFDDDYPGDGDRWLTLCETWDRIAPSLLGSLLTPFPPVRTGLALLARLRTAGGLELVKTLLSPAKDLGRLRFGGAAPQLLLAGNAGHADIPLDAPGSGLFAFLLTMLGQTVGFPVPEGGAGMLSKALERRLRARGGEVVTQARVVRVEIDRGRVTAAVTAEGNRMSARRAVIADVSAPSLYLQLIGADALPAKTVSALRAFQLDPSTVKVDWALSGPVPWAGRPAHAPGTVHLADSVDDMTLSLGQVQAGAVPARPFLLAGQMSAADPTRSPAGTESLWAYTHVPQTVRSDAGDGSIRGAWDRDDCERMADRIQARFEERAPGFSDRIVARRVLGPRELEAMNANLVGGAINGGTAQIHQQLVFRPIPGWGRAETPVRGLYLGSAAAHPGGGVHGAPGFNAARAALAHDRLRPPWRRTSA